MKKFIPVLFFWLLSLPLWPIPADVENISNDKYFPALLKAVKNAQKSIYACLYYISYFPDQKGKVEKILNALVDAVKRGVKVEVILDRGHEEDESGSDLSKKNVRAFSFLKQKGVSVFYDDDKIITHAKYYIVDEDLVILGSFNLSESSLSKNRESGVLIRSSEMAKSFLAEYLEIPKYCPEPVSGAIPIPEEFMRNRELASKMVNKSDFWAMQVYLWLQKKSFEKKTAVLEIPEAELREFFYRGKTVDFRGKDAIQKFMKEQLRFYVKKYPFLKSYRRDGERKVLIVELTAENKPLPESLYLSPEYWTKGWNERLSQRAGFSLFYILEKTSSGRLGRFFSQEKYEAVREYKVSHQIFALGTTELQRFNLIDKDINFRVGERNPNGFTLNSFYDYGEFEKALAKLKAETEAELFKTVSALAVEVNENSDLEVYKRLISLGRKYGLSPLKQILELCRSHPNGISPYRQFVYVEQAIINAGSKNI